MRVLCSCLPEYGHFHPLVPLARAVVAAGHEVAFATAMDFCDVPARAGFRVFPAGIGFEEQMHEAQRRFPSQASLPPGTQRFERFVPRMLAAVAAPPRARDLLGIIAAWQPDLLLHGEAELGAPIAARKAELPYASQSIGPLRPPQMTRRVIESLEPLCEELGLDTGTTLERPEQALFRYLYLDVCPPSLQSAEISAVTVAHTVDAEGKPLAMRTSSAAGRAEAGRPYDSATIEEVPSWLSILPARPTVYVTLGTLNRKDNLLRALVQGVASLDVNVVVTVGPTNHPATLGSQPTNVYIERYIPQSLLLPHLDLVVSHAGSVLPALGHGVPLLMVPQKANEFHNAQACVAAGVGRQIPSAHANPAVIASETSLLLGQAPYREAAERVAQEIADMPGPEEAVRLLELLERQGRPLVRANPEAFDAGGPVDIRKDGRTRARSEMHARKRSTRGRSP